jgi:hypothetical protein
MVDPVIRVGPGDADAAIAHLCEVRQGSRPDGCSYRKKTRCLSKIFVQMAAFDASRSLTRIPAKVPSLELTAVP